MTKEEIAQELTDRPELAELMKTAIEAQADGLDITEIITLVKQYTANK